MAHFSIPTIVLAAPFPLTMYYRDYGCIRWSVARDGQCSREHETLGDSSLLRTIHSGENIRELVEQHACVSILAEERKRSGIATKGGEN